MKVELGNKGLENTWQAPFPETVECVHCKSTAYPVLSIMEESPEAKGFICDLPRPQPKEGDSKTLWPHDATAFAIYLCPNCLKPTALFNQA